LLNGGIESFTADYGAQRILFGSGFPEAHFGGMMMAIKHAQISDQDRQNIASRNLERILSEVLW
jgi:predicted TIM-barrel fold metal-dependent hydrolase